MFFYIIRFDDLTNTVSLNVFIFASSFTSGTMIFLRYIYLYTQYDIYNDFAYATHGVDEVCTHRKVLQKKSISDEMRKNDRTSIGTKSVFETVEVVGGGRRRIEDDWMRNSSGG